MIGLLCIAARQQQAANCFTASQDVPSVTESRWSFSLVLCHTIRTSVFQEQTSTASHDIYCSTSKYLVINRLYNDENSKYSCLYMDVDDNSCGWQWWSHRWTFRHLSFARRTTSRNSGRQLGSVGTRVVPTGAWNESEVAVPTYRR